MSTNEIMLIAIIVIIGAFLAFGLYFGFVFIKSRKKTKRTDLMFSSEKLIEEESLINIMDDKNNFEYSSDDEAKTPNTFVNVDNVNIVKTETKNEPLNPFDVDLTRKTRESRDYIKEDEERQKKKYFQ